MRWRITNNPKWLLMGMITSLLIIGGIGRQTLQTFISQGKIDSEEVKALIVMVLPLVVLILCIKWLFKNYQQYKIKKNRQNMLKIHAKIIGFQPWEKNRYYFVASDGIKEFSSEEFVSHLFWISLDVLKSLQSMKIQYDVNKPEESIQTIENYIQKLETRDSSEIEKDKGIKDFLLTTQIPWLPVWINASSLIKKSFEGILQQLKNGVPHIIVNDKKLSVGDQVEVYIDPLHPENYWIDTDFIYSKDR